MNDDLPPPGISASGTDLGSQATVNVLWLTPGIIPRGAATVPAGGALHPRDPGSLASPVVAIIPAVVGVRAGPAWTLCIESVKLPALVLRFPKCSVSNFHYRPPRLTPHDVPDGLAVHSHEPGYLALATAFAVICARAILASVANGPAQVPTKAVTCRTSLPRWGLCSRLAGLVPLNTGLAYRHHGVLSRVLLVPWRLFPVHVPFLSGYGSGAGIEPTGTGITLPAFTMPRPCRAAATIHYVCPSAARGPAKPPTPLRYMLHLPEYTSRTRRG